VTDVPPTCKILLGTNRSVCSTGKAKIDVIGSWCPHLVLCTHSGAHVPNSDLITNLGPVSPTVVNFNRRFSPHFNLQLAYIRLTNAS